MCTYYQLIIVKGLFILKILTDSILRRYLTNFPMNLRFIYPESANIRHFPDSFNIYLCCFIQIHTANYLSETSEFTHFSLRFLCQKFFIYILFAK